MTNSLPSSISLVILTFCLIMAIPAAISITLSPTYNTLDLNMSIHFTNTTSGLNSSYGTTFSYDINGPVFPLLQNNTITFIKPGNYVVSEMVINQGFGISANSLIVVAKHIGAKITPPFPEAVYNQRETLQANVSGGTPPYTYKWYNTSQCTTAISGATNQSYTTNVLNQTTPTGYCIIINDTYNQQAKASVNINLLTSMDTPQGEVVSVANHTALLAPTILKSNNSEMVENVTPYALFTINLTQCGWPYNVYETGMTPTYANFSIANTPYNLMPDKPQAFGNGDCSVKLLNISWVPIIQTATISFYYQAPATTSTSTAPTTIPTTLRSTISIRPTTSVITSIGTTTLKSTTTIPKNAITVANTVASPTGKIPILDWIGLVVGIVCVMAGVLIFGWLVLKGWKERQTPKPKLKSLSEPKPEKKLKSLLDD